MGKFWSMPYSQKDKEFKIKYGFQPSKEYWKFSEILKALKMERKALLKRMFELKLLENKNKVSPSRYALDNDFFYRVETPCDENCKDFCEHIDRRNNKWIGRNVIELIEQQAVELVKSNSKGSSCL